MADGDKVYNTFVQNECLQEKREFRPTLECMKAKLEDSYPEARTLTKFF